MNRLLRELGLILALAALWAISGYVIGVATELFVESFALETYPFGVIIASINVIVGMSLFKGVTRDPTAERVFFVGFERTAGETEVDIRVGCLWLIPTVLLLYGISFGFVTFLMRILVGK